MASQNIARLGVVLGIDTAEFTAGVDKAIAENKKLKSSIQRETNAAAKEIMALKYAMDDYGKSLTKTEQIQREIATGRFMNATKEAKQLLLDQAKAYDQVAASAQKAGKAQTTMGMLGSMRDGKLNPQQLAALSYQSTDIVTSLAGGQNPLLVLLQQGGQLKDQFGGVTNVFKAFATVLTPLRLALGGLAAVVGTLTFAFFKGMSESQKLRDNLILTGNIAGIVNGQFDVLSKTLSKDLSTSIGNARTIFSALIGSGKFTQESMESVAKAIAMVSKLSGESADVVAKELMGSFDGSASSAKKLNDQYNFLTVAQYRYIEQLNQQGKMQEAAKYTADLLTESLAGQERKLGLIERVLSSTKKAFSEFWDAALDIGRDKTDAEKLADLYRDIQYYGKESPNANSQFTKVRKQRLKEAFDELNQLSAKVMSENDRVASESARKAKEKADIEARIKAGGLQKEQGLEFEYRKQMADEGIQLALNGANEVERIRIESLKKVADVSLKYEQEMLQSGGVFGEALTRNMRQQIDAITKEAEQKIGELSRQKELEYSKRQFQELNSIEKEKEKLDLYQSQLLMTEQDYQIGLARLETEQKIAEIMREQTLSSEAKARLIENQMKLGEAREAVLQLSDRLQTLRSINQSVFSNMGSAIDNFVRTGKFAFKDFARSVIQDIISIQLRAQATKLLGMAMGSFGGFGGSSGPMQLGGEMQYIGPAFANGGSPPVGVPSLVGEKGPELFVPRQAGTIIPNHQLANAMQQPQIVYNGPYIANMSAIDTQSGVQFLMKNKESIWSANQSASRSLPASR
jgi:lambda family phage tail tape measure protein